LPRTSTIARHEKREEIEAAIVRGDPEREIADKYDLSKTAVHDYKPGIADRTKKYTQAGDVALLDHLGELRSLLDESKQIVQTAGEDKRLALQAIDRCMDLVTLIGKWTGEYKESSGNTFNGPVQINLDAQVPRVIEALSAVPCECGKTVDAREWVRGKLIGDA
jgi:hypothetical protein